MQPTDYPAINALLDRLLSQLQAILGTKLVGLYLFGSLVTGDFDDDTSDIDLLAATESDIDDGQFAALNTMQNDIITQYPYWENRLEIAYASLHALKTFKIQTSKIAIISPGEPFHIKEAGKDWLINWYVVREKGVALFGPSAQAIIEPISKEEYIQAVKVQVRDWREWIYHENSRPFQAYAILTMCRALYTSKNGEQVSKRQAALWAAQELPAWSPLIKNALVWRQRWREENVDHEATLVETRRFINVVIDQILS